MRIVRHDALPADPNFHDQWNALVQTMERSQVFYTFEWAQAVSRAYASSVKPLVLAAYRGEELAGVVAFAQDTGRKQVSFLTATTADYCDFISAPADRNKFIEGVMEDLRHFGVAGISLSNLPCDSLSADIVESAVRKVGYSVFTRPAYRCAQVPLDSEEKRSQTRKSARNKLRRLSNVAGDREFAVRHGSSGDELTCEFPDFAMAHVERFLAAGRISNLVRQERRAFLLELGKLLSAQGSLTLSTLKLAGRTIAWNYGFRFGGNWFWYQPAFDRDMAQLSPGTYLLCEILRQASEDPQIHTVDLGLGDEEYKERYSKAGRMTLHITASSGRRKALEVCRYRAAQFVKRSPRLEHGIRCGLAKLQSVRKRILRDGLAGAFRLLASRSMQFLTSRSEVLFFEGMTAMQSQSADLILHPLSFKLLASAAMAYEAEGETLDYILRAAKRLNSAGAEGFALTTLAGVPVHFCWVSPFQGFAMAELRQVLQEPAPGSVLLFDCWTPLSQRGQGYYGQCIAKVGGQMLETDKRPWIFSAATNVSSLRGIVKSGFIPRFSLKRRRRFLVTTISKINLSESPRARMDLYPAA
jgi:CelD/BcsL family acetyltransferase involved in cellulose biosynthesis